jgi:SAM-dependent methyltransferase
MGKTDTTKAADSKFYKAPRYVLRKHNILELLKKNPDVKTFLDVGCGAGELACTLAELGLKGVALDFSPAAIKHAESIRQERGLSSDSIEFFVGGLEAVKGRQFDLIICSEVLEHIEDDATMLRNLLKHSKKLLISVPAKQRLFDSSDKAVGHFRRYEKAQLQELLESHDLRIDHFVNYGYPFTNMVRLARKAMFARKLRANASESMEDKSKESGINPVKLPIPAHKIDTERLFYPAYKFSKVFNHRDLGEGYLVFCEKAEV